jgi:hypothetical protein
MPDIKLQIQMARVRDDVEAWLGLVEDLAQHDFFEGMKAAASGIVRAYPGSAIKEAAVGFVLKHLETLAAIDLAAAMEIALTASVATKPATAERQETVDFIVKHLPAYMHNDARAAYDKALFASRWAMPGSPSGRQAEALLAKMGERPVDAAVLAGKAPAEQRRAS